MKQNKYDDASFFDRYSQMARSVEGLEGAGEWPALRSLLPNLAGKCVLDLGCGFGWHCRYVCEQGARAVIGVDLSEKMLARAMAEANDPNIEYKRCAIEDGMFEIGQFDLVLSSLAFHYESSSVRSAGRFSTGSPREVRSSSRSSTQCSRQ